MPVQKLHEGKTLDIYSVSTDTRLSLPLISEGIRAGFPSPAMDFEDIRIDLNQYLIKNPSATFYGKVRGDSLKNAGIEEGDILIIDKSVEPADGKIAVCFLDGEFTAKRIRIRKNKIWLMPENEKYKPIEVTEENQFIIWGIVTYVIKPL
jgi:SOS response UmuD protein. Serine peptidase. MEROPS family S24